MIKGLERKIMLLKSINSKYFDQAYFIMKDDIITCDESEILREAEKIIFSAEGCKRIKKSNKKGILKLVLISVLCTLVGFGVGIAFAFII